jgi:hypothetical protein
MYLRASTTWARNVDRLPCIPISTSALAGGVAGTSAAVMQFPDRAALPHEHSHATGREASPKQPPIV